MATRFYDSLWRNLQQFTVLKTNLTYLFELLLRFHKLQYLLGYGVSLEKFGNLSTF